MIQDIVNTWLDDMQRDLISNYNRLGLRASGAWADSLEQFKDVQAGKLKIGILANDYTTYLENGRNPNKNQTPEALKSWVGWAGSTFLDKWVQDKKINANPFAIAWKIAREGWRVPNQHNAGGLVSDVVTREKVYELNRKLVFFYADNLKSDVIKILN
jgi:hypothetical protein